MDDLKLLRISYRVAGSTRRAKTVTIELPYAKGVDLWKLEQKGKLPASTKEAIIEIVRGHGGKHPKYEEDGLFFDVPADQAESAAEDLEHLHGVDKAFKSLFDLKELLKRTTPKERKKPEKKPSRAEKKADKLLAEMADDEIEPGAEPAPEPEPAPKAPAKKPSKVEPAKKPDPKPAPKPKAEPAKGKPGRRVFNPSDKPKRGPAAHGDVMESINNLRRTVRDDDEDAFMDAVRGFLDTIDYESWA